ncbi:hypothetical protein QZH41_015029 [Actinostola sp. cb2023]|nr:hypothetical protein QZH41_015029 [Actinostola sp. cb2023]
MEVDTLHAGSNKIYDSSYIATLGDVIVVAINYRLNVFGFLATGSDGDLKGNYGMLDQIHALKWVKKNIRAFGGNPKKVTIFGDSAGGASVALLVLSPLTKGLFLNAILQSGDANAIWAYKLSCETLDLAKLIGKDNGCTNVDT